VVIGKNLPAADAHAHLGSSMSYVHCPACSRAYNLATQSACPCRDDIAAAIETLARALARATPAERAAAAPAMQRLALPAPEPTWQSAPGALAPVPPRPVSKRKQLAAIALAVIERIARRATRYEPDLVRSGRRRVSALLAR
jgi:hypothetical protein